MVRFACPIAFLGGLFTFGKRGLDALAQPTGTLSIQPTCKNRHHREHVTRQLFGWLLDVRLIQHFESDVLPRKRLLQIATPKAHQTVRICNQDDIDRLLSYQGEELLHAPPPLVKSRCPFGDYRHDLKAPSVSRFFEARSLPRQMAILFLPHA